ncbi:hypothetical protein [Ferrimonas sediminum]|nr:hypothetical protein [Ferrimonas sediminum]
MINQQGQLLLRSGGKPLMEGLPGSLAGPLVGKFEMQQEQRKLTLFRAGDSFTLKLLSPTTPQTGDAVFGGQKPPVSQGSLLELLRQQPELKALLPALAQRLGTDSGGEKTLMPSLAQYASPALLKGLFAALGSLPAANGATPIGTLLALWFHLQARKGRPVSESGALSSLSEATKATTSAGIADLFKQMTEFQRQSQLDGDNQILYYAFPYEQERVQRELQLGLARYPEAGDNEFWLLTLRFELSLGNLLVRARYQDDALQMSLVTDSRTLAHRVDEQVETLVHRFQDHGLQTTVPRCQVGDVPDSIAQPAKRMTYGAMGR